jgi:hypothetical protein
MLKVVCLKLEEMKKIASMMTHEEWGAVWPTEKEEIIFINMCYENIDKLIAVAEAADNLINYIAEAIVDVNPPAVKLRDLLKELEK